MCGKQIELAGHPRCRRTFADERRCRLAAHPDHDGLCFDHGTLSQRASRRDNFLRELRPLSKLGFTENDFQHAISAIERGRRVRRVASRCAICFSAVALLGVRSEQMVAQEEFRTGCGPRWERLRKLIDCRDSAGSTAASPGRRKRIQVKLQDTDAISLMPASLVPRYSLRYSFSNASEIGVGVRSYYR